jgi:Holliday junction resolvase RusA-like endonuclease
MGVNTRYMEKLFFRAPLPPSSNKQYWAQGMMRGGKPIGMITPSKDLKDYKKDFGVWHTTFRKSLLNAEARLKDWESRGIYARVDCYICMPKDRIWTLKNTPKMMDLKNRLKALHDCLAESLNYDDSKFFAGYDEKCTTEQLEPWVFVVISPHVPRSIETIDMDKL